MATRFLHPTAAAAHYDPLVDLHREMNRLFDDVFGVNPARAEAAWTPTLPPPGSTHEPAEQELTVEAELPGVDRADLDVRLDGDVLTISERGWRAARRRRSAARWRTPRAS